MEKETQRRFESIFSTKVKAGRRRTYFFDVRKTKGDDYYITLTESTRKYNGEGYERHKIFLYKEDFNRFIDSLGEAIDYVKTELMPDYDYDEFAKKHEEWESNHQNNTPPKSQAEEPANKVSAPEDSADPESADSDKNKSGDLEDDVDMSW